MSARKVSSAKAPLVLLAALAVLAAAVLVAGCGGSDDSTSGDTSASGGSTSGETSGGETSGGADTAAAEEIVQQFNKPMTIQLKKLPKAPPEDVKFVYAACSVPSCQSIAEGAIEAGEALGWDTQRVNFTATGPQEIVQAMDQVVAEKPEVVGTASISKTEFAEPLEKLAADEVPVAVASSPDGPGDGIVANVSGPRVTKISGKTIAAYVVAEAGEDANVLMFNIPDFKVLVPFETSFEEEFKSLCPECGYEAVALTADNIGKDAPTIVTSAFQRNPDANYAVFSFGDITSGVPAALASAGLDDVKIVGQSPSEPNIAALESEEEDMWLAKPLATSGWLVVDALARQLTGGDPAETEFMPAALQFLTPENIGGEEEQVAYNEVPDNNQVFEELWDKK